MSDSRMQHFAMGKYILQFTGISALISVLLLAFTMLTEIELPGSTGIISLIATLAAIAPGIAKTTGRELTKRERAAFALWSSLISLAISAVLMLGGLAFAGVPINADNLAALLGSSEIPAGVLALIAAAAVAIGWVATYFILGSFVKQQLKRLHSAAKQ